MVGIILTIFGLVVLWQVFKKLTGVGIARNMYIFENEVEPFMYECLAKGITCIQIPRKYVDVIVTVYSFQKERHIDRQGNNYLRAMYHLHTGDIWIAVIDGVKCEMTLAPWEDIREALGE